MQRRNFQHFFDEKKSVPFINVELLLSITRNYLKTYISFKKLLWITPLTPPSIFPGTKSYSQTRAESPTPTSDHNGPIKSKTSINSDSPFAPHRRSPNSPQRRSPNSPQRRSPITPQRKTSTNPLRHSPTSPQRQSPKNNRKSGNFLPRIK